MAWMLSLMLVILMGTPVQGWNDSKTKQQIELYAKAAVLMDGNSGRILYGKNSNLVLPMASTTKIMTCILALEEGHLDRIVTTSSYAASQPKVHLGMRRGENYHLKDLLYAMMLESYNDSAAAVAEGTLGTKEAFLNRMNEKAQELGCIHTFFVTPNGLDGEQNGKKHGTTAKELAKIMTYCVNQSPARKEFIQITQTRSYSFQNVEKTRTFSCGNHNAFLSMNPNALSGKTGFTAKAGYCYVGAVKRKNHLLIVALLACGWPNHKRYKWSDTKRLIDYGLSQYRYESFENILPNTKILPEIEIVNGQYGYRLQPCYINLKYNNRTAETWPKGILLSANEEQMVVYCVPEQLKAPIYEGQIVGYIKCRVNQKNWKCYELLSDKTILERTWVWCIKVVFQKILMKREG